MKKRLNYKLLILFPALALSACGYGLKEIYSDDYYNSANFMMNYYDTWNSKIDPNNKDNKVVEGETFDFTNDPDKYFTRWNDPLFIALEENRASSLDDDGLHYHDFDNKHDAESDYTEYYKLSAVESDFKYGVISKLFDGQGFCYGDTTKARIQIASDREKDLSEYTVDNPKNSGFGYVLPMQYAGGSNYLAFNFKAFIEINTQMANYLGCESPASVGSQDDNIWDITIYLGLYVKEDKVYVKHTVIMNIDDVSANGGINSALYDVNSSNAIYSLVGFPLSNLKVEGEVLDLSGLAGISIEYSLNSITYRGNVTQLIGNESLLIEKMNEYQLHHSLWLYEFLMPNSKWR